MKSFKKYDTNSALDGKKDDAPFADNDINNQILGSDDKDFSGFENDYFLLQNHKCVF